MRYIVKKEAMLMDFLMLYYSRKQVKQFLKYKQVMVNGSSQTQYDYSLVKDDIVEIIKESKSDHNLDILYEDKEFVVINKPSGLLSMSGGGEKEKTAYHLVSEYVKQTDKNARIFIVHRLDRDTSGVLLFAKNEKIKKVLQDHWNENVTKRGYIAVVEGNLKKKHGTIKNYLAESKTQNVYIANKQTGKLAITNYRVIKETRKFSMLEIFLETGRKNQIRVHMQSLGHSIVGDKKYGAISNPIKRLGLHANVFAFNHPLTHKNMEFVAKTPIVFEELVKK